MSAPVRPSTALVLAQAASALAWLAVAAFVFATPQPWWLRAVDVLTFALSASALIGSLARRRRS